MTEKKKYLLCERLWIFVLLIFVAGIYGAYTMSVRGGVFCNAQTGNMVRFGIAIGTGNWGESLYFLVPMVGYLMGSMVAEILPRHVRQFRLRWDTLLMLIEIVTVIVVGFIPASAPHQISQIIINFICAMQYNTFRQAEGIGSATTFCTNHTRMLGSNLSRILFRRQEHPDAVEKARSHGVMLLSFTLGAAAAGFLCIHFGVYAIWFALIPLTVLFAVMLRADLSAEKDLLAVAPRGH